MHNNLSAYLSLSTLITGEDEPRDHSLFSGRAGLAWYHYHAYCITGSEKHKKEAERIAWVLCDELFSAGDHHDDIAFATGITGACAVLHFFHSMQFIKQLPQGAANMDEYLYRRALQYSGGEPFSFTDGITGIIGYFCKRTPGPVIQYYLENLANHLLSVHNDDVWNKPEINFSLWQGLCGKISLLFRLLFSGFTQVRQHLQKCVQALRSQVLQIDAGLNRHSFFPVSADESTGLVHAPNHLFWGSGDLPAAYILHKAGTLFGNNDYKKTAALTGAYTLTRKTADETQVQDAGFYSGACGTAMMYRVLEQESGLAMYREGYMFWLNRSIELLDRQMNNGDIAHSKHALATGLPGMMLTWLCAQHRAPAGWTDIFLP